MEARLAHEQLVTDYFGEKVALYFGFLALYNQLLLWPALMGTLVFIYQLLEGFDAGYVVPVYACMLAIWCTFLTEGWKRQQARCQPCLVPSSFKLCRTQVLLCGIVCLTVL